MTDSAHASVAVSVHEAPSSRNLFADALKALALLGVFLVNGMGYFSAPENPAPLGSALPAHSAISVAAHAMVFTLFAGKALPMLAFLFGHSLGLLAKRMRCAPRGARTALDARYRRLLLVGVLHGSLLYFGDVLTAYAICALWVSRWLNLSTRLLVRKLLTFGWIAVVIWLVSVSTNYSFLGHPSLGDWVNKPNFSTTTGIGRWFGLNITAYVSLCLDMIFYLPQLMALTLAGMVCARLNLLQPHRSLSQRVWRHPSWLRVFAVGALAQVVLTSALVWYSQQDSLDYLWVLPGLNAGFGLCWAMGALALVARRSDVAQSDWVVLLSPAGRYTLVLYLGLSAWLALSAPAWSGRWLVSHGLHPLGHTAMALIVLLLAWGLGVWACRRAAAYHWKDPLTRWLGQTTAFDATRQPPNSKVQA